MLPQRPLHLDQNTHLCNNNENFLWSYLEVLNMAQNVVNKLLSRWRKKEIVKEIKPFDTLDTVTSGALWSVKHIVSITFTWLDM